MGVNPSPVGHRLIEKPRLGLFDWVCSLGATPDFDIPELLVGVCAKRTCEAAGFREAASIL